MYGFLILPPLTLVSVLIGYFIASSTQAFDYVVYITELLSTPERFCIGGPE